MRTVSIGGAANGVVPAPACACAAATVSFVAIAPAAIAVPPSFRKSLLSIRVILLRLTEDGGRSPEDGERLTEDGRAGMSEIAFWFSVLPRPSAVLRLASVLRPPVRRQNERHH